MDYGTIIAFACLIPASFALGWVVRHKLESKCETYWRTKHEWERDSVAALVASCRKVLADSWFKKVMRGWRWDWENYVEGGAK